MNTIAYITTLVVVIGHVSSQEPPYFPIEFINSFLPNISRHGADLDKKFNEPLMKRINKYGDFDYIKWGINETVFHGWDRIELNKSSVYCGPIDRGLNPITFMIVIPKETTFVTGKLTIQTTYKKGRFAFGPTTIPVSLKANNSIQFNCHVDFSGRQSTAEIKSVYYPERPQFVPIFDCPFKGNPQRDCDHIEEQVTLHFTSKYRDFSGLKAMEYLLLDSFDKYLPRKK